MGAKSILKFCLRDLMSRILDCKKVLPWCTCSSPKLLGGEERLLGFWTMNQAKLVFLCLELVVIRQRFVCLGKTWGPGFSEVHIPGPSLGVIMSSDIWGRICLSLRQLAQQTGIVSGGTEEDGNSINQRRWSRWSVGDTLPSLGGPSFVRFVGTHRHLSQQLYFICYLLKFITHKHILHNSTYLLYKLHQIVQPTSKENDYNFINSKHTTPINLTQLRYSREIYNDAARNSTKLVGVVGTIGRVVVVVPVVIPLVVVTRILFLFTTRVLIKLSSIR